MHRLQLGNHARQRNRKENINSVVFSNKYSPKKIFDFKKCAHKHTSLICAYYKIQCARNLAIKPCKIEEMMTVEVSQNDLTTITKNVGTSKCAHKHISFKCAHYKIQCVQTLAMKPCKIEKQEIKISYNDLTNIQKNC